MRTLPREPWRGSQICGWQIAYGMPRSEFCAERKAEGLVWCAEHHQDAMEDYGTRYHVPDDVARGDHKRPVRLLWEPYEDDQPIEPSYEEMTRYAGALRGGE